MKPKCSPEKIHLDSAGGYLHDAHGKGGKHGTCIIPKPTLEVLGAYLQGRGSGTSLRAEV